MEQAVQIKKIANFDLEQENALIRLSVNDFLFNLQALHDYNSEQQAWQGREN